MSPKSTEKQVSTVNSSTLNIQQLPRHSTSTMQQIHLCLLSIATKTHINYEGYLELITNSVRTKKCTVINIVYFAVILLLYVLA